MFAPTVNQINAVLQTHAQTPLSVGELQRLAGIPDYATAKNALAGLERRGLAIRGERAGKPTYAPNQRSQYAVAARVTAVLAPPWAEALMSGGVGLSSVRAVYVFGSLARGNFGPTSDWDVLIIGSATEKSVRHGLARIGTMTGRTVDSVTMRSAEVEDRLERSDSFIAAALAGLLVFGEPVSWP